MKRKQLILLCVLFCLHGIIHSQEPLTALGEKKVPKPSLFISLPEQQEISSSELHRMLSGQLNEPFTVQLSNYFQLAGAIVERNQHTPGSVSVNIRVHNYDNALFNMTMHFLADNSTTIKGRILHPKYGDVLELYKMGDKYYFRKSSQRLYMPE